MAQSFEETAHRNIDQKKFKENYDQIDWGELKDRPIDKDKAKETKRHVTAGLCGESGFKAFDEEKFKENFDQIDWGKKGE